MACTLVTVAPLKTEDVPAVRALLISGLTERWGKYEPRFNPDIEAFPQSYEDSVILVAKSGAVVVGTGTLRPIAESRAEVVRMSVSIPNRRSGVGGRVLRCLLQVARERGVQEVVLETTSSWASAVAFYTKHGFIKTAEQDEDTYFIYRIR